MGSLDIPSFEITWTCPDITAQDIKLYKVYSNLSNTQSSTVSLASERCLHFACVLTHPLFFLGLRDALLMFQSQFLHLLHVLFFAFLLALFPRFVDLPRHICHRSRDCLLLVQLKVFL